MKRKIARKAIAQIAKMEGIKESEVRAEINRAILEGYKNRATRGNWNAIFGENTIPSPEEFITAIGGIVAKKEQYTL